MEGDDIEIPVFITGIELPKNTTGKRALTNQQALEIYNRRGLHKVIAFDYGIPVSTVSSIKTKRRYKHIHERKKT